MVGSCLLTNLGLKISVATQLLGRFFCPYHNSAKIPDCPHLVFMIGGGRVRLLLAIDMTYLIENGSSRANEAPFEHLFDAVSIGYGVTNVKDLALISHVGIVTVHSAIASEFIN